MPTLAWPTPSTVYTTAKNSIRRPTLSESDRAGMLSASVRAAASALKPGLGGFDWMCSCRQRTNAVISHDLLCPAREPGYNAGHQQITPWNGSGERMGEGGVSELVQPALLVPVRPRAAWGLAGTLLDRHFTRIAVLPTFVVMLGIFGMPLA